ncbi:hypothetical protein FPG87_02870 [Flavobacterium psychrophilum]|nr:hypothetical protein FPG87_02870 [Flavobacterium psychrophilum]
MRIYWNYRFLSYFRFAENTRLRKSQTAQGARTLPAILPKKTKLITEIKMIKLNKNLKKLIIPSIGGLLLTAYLLYDQKGTLGMSEFIVLIITAVVIFGVILIINKITPKND